MSLSPGNAEFLLLHNPRCSKSRAALALLEERGADFEVRAYLDEPLTRAELGELKAALGKPVTEWVRSKERAFGEAGLSEGASEAEIFDAMIQTPILLERPILLRGDRAVVGRPTENLEELL